MDFLHFISEPVKWTDVGLLLIAALTAFFAVRQIRETGRQINISQQSAISDHERSRRMSAVDLCIQWTQFLEPEIRAIAKLFENFTEQQCITVSDFRPMKVSADEIHVLNSIFSNRAGFIAFQETDISDGSLTLSPSQVLFLRHSVLKYLNMLESVLLSYTQSTANKQIIMEEFKYIFEEHEQETALDNFRRAVGNENYPSINIFIREIKRKKRKSLMT